MKSYKMKILEIGNDIEALTRWNDNGIIDDRK